MERSSARHCPNMTRRTLSLKLAFSYLQHNRTNFSQQNANNKFHSIYFTLHFPWQSVTFGSSHTDRVKQCDADGPQAMNRKAYIVFWNGGLTCFHP